MKFVLSLNVDNDAFTPAPYAETARILRAIANRLDTATLDPGPKRGILGDYHDAHGGWTGHFQTATDINGNDVGRYAFKNE